jgi:hypothetical protein
VSFTLPYCRIKFSAARVIFHIDILAKVLVLGIAGLEGNKYFSYYLFMLKQSSKLQVRFIILDRWSE